MAQIHRIQEHHYSTSLLHCEYSAATLPVATGSIGYVVGGDSPNIG